MNSEDKENICVAIVLGLFFLIVVGTGIYKDIQKEKLFKELEVPKYTSKVSIFMEKYPNYKSMTTKEKIEAFNRIP